MIFAATRFDVAWLIDIERREDERGFFARTWCRQELAGQGLDTGIAQESLSFNRYRGTVRGLHFQRPPHEETKIVLSLATNKCFAAMKPMAIPMIGSGVSSAITCLPLDGIRRVLVVTQRRLRKQLPQCLLSDAATSYSPSH
jgi:hypothetical protein